MACVAYTINYHNYIWSWWGLKQEVITARQGVPQGSVLGLEYVNDLLCCVEVYRQFLSADNTTLIIRSANSDELRNKNAGVLK